MVGTLDAFFADCPSLLFVAAEDGTLTRVSAALERRFGHRFADARSLAALAEPESEAALADALAKLETEAEADCTLRSTGADGRPIELRCVVRRGANASILGEIEWRPVAAEPMRERLEPLILRAILDNLDITVWVIDPDGRYVLQDGNALERTGLERDQLQGMSVFELNPELGERWVKPALAGEYRRSQSEYRGVNWDTWTVPIAFDEHTTYCAGISVDVSERVEAQRSLEQQLETVRSQQAAILELSAPVLNVWDQVVAVPLIGMMDSDRTDELTDRLLEAAHRSQTRFVILDLTGVDAVDTSIAAHVLRLLKSLELLGVVGLVTGVSPEVARTMVAVGIDFEDVKTHRTLREGLRHCMATLLGIEED